VHICLAACGKRSKKRECEFSPHNLTLRFFRYPSNRRTISRLRRAKKQRKLLKRDLASSWQIEAGGVGYFLHPQSPGGSRRPSVVVMQAIEDWECYDMTVSLGVVGQNSIQRLIDDELPARRRR